ncbi:Hydroxyacylglutathione hydrolase [anaerobic digester metagenome]
MKKFTSSRGTGIFSIAGGRSNVFLVHSGDKKILVDTGPRFMQKIVIRRLKKLGIQTIDYLVLTHTHFDHAANARAIKHFFNARVIVHVSEEEFLKSGDSPVPAGTNLFTGWLTGNFGKLANRMVKYQGCDADITIDHLLILSEDLKNIQIIHTPGHSAGSVSVIIDNEIALAGDTLFGTYPGSCFPPFADDRKLLFTSWELLLKTGCRVFFPSHGSVRTREQVSRELKKENKAIPRQQHL